MDDKHAGGRPFDDDPREIYQLLRDSGFSLEESLKKLRRQFPDLNLTKDDVKLIFLKAVGHPKLSVQNNDST